MSPVGRTLGHYRVVAKLGGGARGVVYKALDLRLDRVVALKLLPAHLCESEADKRRFVTEAKAASALDHPNICTVHEIAEADEGQIYIVMAYYPGETLRSRIQSANSLPVPEAVAIAIQMASGLAKAHSRGVIHRDVKPANIMVTDDNQVKIVDFGLAKMSSDPSITQTGSLLGTPAYMSPEQIQGEGIDHRTDIWSLGVVLYEMLSGSKPFYGESVPAVLKAIATWVPEPLATRDPEIPVELSNLVGHALVKDPANRLGSMESFQQALGTLTVSEGASQSSSTFTVLRSLALAPETSQKSIAVLPFRNISTDRENQYFCEGLAEDLINGLSRIRGLRVAARTSAFAFQGRDVPLEEIGRALDVETALEGSVRRAGQRLRIVAQLVSVENGHLLWSDRWDRDIGDIFSIQDEISLAIVDTLKVKLLGDETARVRRYTDNLDAYRLYLQGRYFWNQRNAEGMKKGLEYFGEAIRLDPAYALAHAGLADSFNVLGYWGFLPPREAFARAKEASDRALQLDDSLAEAHAALALNKMYCEWDWTGAERELVQAARHNPGYANTYYYWGIYHVIMGDLDEAERMMRRALEIDPLSLMINTVLGGCHYIARRYEEAIEQLEQTLVMDEDFLAARIFLGWVNSTIGRYSDAEVHYERALEAFQSPLAAGFLGYAYGLHGKTSQARGMLKELDSLERSAYVSPLARAMVFLGLGATDEAIALLTQAHEEREPQLVFLNQHPLFDGLRQDQRFTALLASMGLRDA